MLSLTTTQIAIMVLLLVAGWFFGLASHSGGAKWKARYVAERDAHATARKDGDTRAVAAEKRVAELERENARLASAAPVAAPVASPVAARARPNAVAAARPAYPASDRRGWFDFSR